MELKNINMFKIKLLDHPSRKTFKDGRKCRHCSTPIADQENKSREFCRKRVFLDGLSEDCHQNYWSPQRRLAAQKEKADAVIKGLFLEDLEGLGYLNNIQIGWNSFSQLGVRLDFAQNNYVSEDGLVFVFKQGYLVIAKKSYSVTFKTI